MSNLNFTGRPKDLTGIGAAIVVAAKTAGPAIIVAAPYVAAAVAGAAIGVAAGYAIDKGIEYVKDKTK
jgi:hypothetical protein